jgi:hypothetical protein
MEKMEQEETAATVFSYLIRGLSGNNGASVRSELMQKLMPIKELYGLADDVYPIYIDFCMKNKKFLKVQDTIEAFGTAIANGKVSSKDERIMLRWVSDVMNGVRTNGNIKVKRR